MIPVGSEVFLQDPNASAAADLHNGRVVELRTDTLILEFDDLGPIVGPGDDAVLFVDLQGEFMRGSIRIDAVLTDPPHPILAVQLTDELVNAEQRTDPRYSTVFGAITADIKTDRDCPVVDIGTTGLAVISSHVLEAGDSIAVTLRDHVGQTFSGHCRVMSAREIRRGRTRYGLQLISGRAAGEDLSIGLQRITMDVKRHQFRQRTRSA